MSVGDEVEPLPSKVVPAENEAMSTQNEVASVENKAVSTQNHPASIKNEASEGTKTWSSTG